MVSVLALFSDDPSLNPAKVNNIINHLKFLKKNKKEKEAGEVPLKNSLCTKCLWIKCHLVQCHGTRSTAFQGLSFALENVSGDGSDRRSKSNNPRRQKWAKHFGESVSFPGMGTTGVKK